MKVLFWILGIIGAIVVALIVAGFVVERSMQGHIDEAAKFAANATKQDCVEEMAKQVDACDGFGCTMGKSFAGSACWLRAKGDRTEFCRNVPDVKDRAGLNDWSESFCAQHALKKDSCNKAAVLVAAHCRSET